MRRNWKDLACEIYPHLWASERFWWRPFLKMKVFWGTFNNYVDQLLPNFDPLPPRVDKRGHFTYLLSTKVGDYYLPFVTWPHLELSTDPLTGSTQLLNDPLRPCGKAIKTNSTIYCLFLSWLCELVLASAPWVLCSITASLDKGRRNRDARKGSRANQNSIAKSI